MHKQSLLEHIKRHVDLNSNEKEILNYFDIKLFSKKSFLLTEGKMSRCEYFIISGCVRVFVTDNSGLEHNLSFNSENWWVGDLKSFIKNEVATYSIQAIEDITVLQINHKSWLNMLNDFPVMEKYFRIMFQNAVFAQQTRIVQSISYTAEERYLSFIKSYPKVIQRISQKHIASYLGITPESLSRIRKEITKN